MPIIYGGKGKLLGGGTFVPWYLSGGVDPAHCVQAQQPQGAVSLASSYANIADTAPLHPVGVGVAPNLVAGGWELTGTQYLTCDLSFPTATQTYTIIIRATTGIQGASSNTLFGEYTWVGEAELLCLKTTEASAILLVNGKMTGLGGVGNVPDNTPIVMAIAGNTGYRDGNILVSLLPVGVTTFSHCYIGGHNVYGLNYAFHGVIHAISIYDIVLTQAQIQAIGSAPLP
jgi:hypothetical protein